MKLVSWWEVVKADPCSYCGGAGGTVDHIRPLNRGGKNHAGNLTGACSDCNGRKANLSLIGFLLGGKKGPHGHQQPLQEPSRKSGLRQAHAWNALQKLVS